MYLHLIMNYPMNHTGISAIMIANDADRDGFGYYDIYIACYVLCGLVSGYSSLDSCGIIISYLLKFLIIQSPGVRVFFSIM